MKTTYTLGTIAISLTMAAVPAQAIDVGPADYTIVPSGTAVGMIYYQHLSSDRLDIDGDDVSGSTFEADVAILRGLYYTEYGGLPAVWHLVMPFSNIGDVDIGTLPQDTTSGIGDTTVGLTLWPVQPDTPETGTTLGLSLFATAPTGNYDPNSIGIGEGTWSITPQVGLIQGLGNGFHLDAALDVAFSMDHTEDGDDCERAPSWQLQTMLRKQWGPTSVTFGYNGQRGGEQKVNGVETGLKTHRDQLRLYGSHWIDQTTQIQGMYAKDINVEGGFEYDNVFQLRLVKVF
ncbi:possible phenol degradation enzyme [Rhodovulum sulfidophilum]|uniref:Possible phenol degradation enzyme n=1 Tax=Rhodovulum sulfidophilum TaxID=35806 RepID=A0A0D6B5U7_RHOSU|nr:possible phenol degradation enzyme [Rhodovulum sulfidophilum]